MYKRLLLLSFLLAGASRGWAQATPIETRLQGIDSLLETLLDEYHVAGFSVAVVHKDSVVYAKGFGLVPAVSFLSTKRQFRCAHRLEKRWIETKTFTVSNFT